MKKWMQELQSNETENHIIPFLWMKGEDQATIRTEVEKIYECGIRAICVEARPHPEFGKDGWWADLRVVIEQAERLGMKVWILDDKHFPTGYANGLIEEKYPERKKIYLNYEVCDVSGTGEEHSFDIMQMKAPGLVFWEMDKKIDFEQRGKNKVKKVLLMKRGSDKLIYEGCTDVTNLVDEKGMLTLHIPAGAYRIMTVYTTRTDGGAENYINMMDMDSCQTQLEAVYIPHYEQFKDKFGTTIMGFFSDEPQFGNEPLFPCHSVVGKEKMPIPWSKEAEEMMKQVLGEAWGSYLPYLWFDSVEMKHCPKLRYEYMNIASCLYQKNFSSLLGDWCTAHGVEYIGHVVEDNNAHSRLGMGAAHYFRAMEGQHMAGIDAIGGQICFGSPEQTRHNMIDIDGEFFHYILGKLGASCAHLDPKKKGRLMCELFGATGWRTGVKEMRFILDHLLAQGVNYLVPHAFSMAEYPDPDCAPHFYARGNHPEFLYFKELMMYANRMCSLLSGGRHKASVAVLYDAELEWGGRYVPMQKVCRNLMEHQIDFEIVSIDMLIETERYGTEIKEGRLVVNGVGFEALLLPEAERIPLSLAQWITSHPQVEVFFMNAHPKCIVNAVTESDGAVIRKVTEQTSVIKMNALAVELRKKGYYDITLKEAYPMLTAYHYVKEEDVYLFVNESAEQIYRGTICLNSDRPLLVYDALNNQFYALQSKLVNSRQQFEIELIPGQSIVVVECDDKEGFPVYMTMSDRLAECKECRDISNDWNVSTVRAIEYPGFGNRKNMEQLVPYSRIDATFSGIIKYEKEIEIQSLVKTYFKAEYVNDVMQIWVNGIKFSKKIAAPFIYDITDAIIEGKNKICVEVATTLEREQENYPKPPFVFSFESKLATGMYGKIELISK